MKQQAILFVSHGSRSRKSRQENQALAAWLRQNSGVACVEYAFLEVEHPTIPEGLRKCAESGAGQIIVLLNFLNSGKHILQDIPEILDRERKKYPDLDIQAAAPLGAHPGIPKLFLDLFDRAVRKSKKEGNEDDGSEK